MRRAGLIKRKVRAFSGNVYSQKHRAAVAARLTDLELLWANYLPDHKVDAKTSVLKELNRRGYLEQDIFGWLPPKEDVAVPNAYQGASSRASYYRLIRLKSISIKSYRWFLLLPFGSLILLWIISAVYDAPRSITDASWENQLAFFGNRYVAAGFSWSYHLFMYGSLALLATSIITSMVLARLSMRILLLRPFGDRKMTKPLKRLVVNALGRMGYVFTFSDRGYRPNLFLTVLLYLPVQGFNWLVLLFLSPSIRNSSRIATIKSERKLRQLQSFLLHRFRPSWMSFLSGGQAFNIRSTNQWWQAAILSLMHSSDIIVVDLSAVKGGTDWELGVLKCRGLLNKCIFVVGDACSNSLERCLSRYFTSEDRPVVHVYSRRGMPTNETAFFTQLMARTNVALDQRMSEKLGGRRHITEP
jgi:nucleoside 2-deoxyribosyltransferase